MKLPNGAHAIVEMEKLLGYYLNLHHPRGRNKALVFASIGIGKENAAELPAALFRAARDSQAQPDVLDAYRQRYTIDFDLIRYDRTATIRNSWIVLTGEKQPRLTTCYLHIKV